jgi:hypothetical protein
LEKANDLCIKIVSFADLESIDKLENPESWVEQKMEKFFGRSYNNRITKVTKSTIFKKDLVTYLLPV